MCVAIIDVTPKPLDLLFGDYGCASPWLLKLQDESILRRVTMQLSLTLGIRRTFVYGRNADFRDQSFGDRIIHPWPGGIQEALRYISSEYPSKRLLLIDRPLAFAKSIDFDTLLCLAHYRQTEEAIAIQTRNQADKEFPAHHWVFSRDRREIGIRAFSPERIHKLITDDILEVPILTDLGFTIETPGDYEYARAILHQSRLS